MKKIFLAALLMVSGSAFSNTWSEKFKVTSLNQGGGLYIDVETNPASSCGKYRLYLNENNQNAESVKLAYSTLLSAMISSKDVKVGHSGGSRCAIANVHIFAD